MTQKVTKTVPKTDTSTRTTVATPARLVWQPWALEKRGLLFPSPGPPFGPLTRIGAKAARIGAELEPTGAELAENGTDLQAALICYAPSLKNVDIPLDNLLDHSQPLADVDGIPGSLQLLAVQPVIASGVSAGASNHLSHAGAPD